MGVYISTLLILRRFEGRKWLGFKTGNGYEGWLFTFCLVWSFACTYLREREFPGLAIII